MKSTILKFRPILKTVLWGGDRIAEFKNLETDLRNIGESWEISPMEGHESVVAEGEYRGITLNELVDRYGDRLLGRHVMKTSGRRFPLLIKLIDSNDDLSVQVHPDDKLAELRHNSLGKTEMWYSLSPTEGAYLYSGFNRVVDKTEFVERIKDNTVIEMLNKFYPKEGDIYFLPAGRVHSIGKGNFVLEVQEASDITYRIYDYDRRDKDGNLRQLHIDESIDAIDFDDVTDAYVPNIHVGSNETAEVFSCRYFAMEEHNIHSTKYVDLTGRDSFTVGFVADGTATVRTDGKYAATVRKGETFLVPAVTESLWIESSCRLLTIHIP